MDVRAGLWRRLSAEELMLLNCGVGEDSWQSLGLQGDPTSPFWRRSTLGFLWKEWCWSPSTLATSCEELTHWKRLWCWEGLGAGGEGDDRGWGGWMPSPTRWTWVWVNSRSWWWTGRPGMLWFMGSQRVRHDWVTELNWRLSLVISINKNSGTLRTPVPTHSLPCLGRFLKNPEWQEFKLLYHRGLLVPLIYPVHSLMFKTLMFLTQSEGNKCFIPTVFPIPMNMLPLCPQTLSDIRFPFGGEINEARSGTNSHRFLKILSSRDLRGHPV